MLTMMEYVSRTHEWETAKEQLFLRLISEAEANEIYAEHPFIRRQRRFIW